MSEKEKRDKINKALDAFVGGGAPTDSKTQKREKIEQALGAFAGEGSFTDIPIGGMTVDKKMKKGKLEKGFLETHLPVTGGTITRSTKKSKRRGSLTILTDPSTLAPPANQTSSNNSPILQSLSPRNLTMKATRKRRSSLFSDLAATSSQSEEMEEQSAQANQQINLDVDGITSILQMKDLSSLPAPQIIDLLEEVDKIPRADEVSMLGLVRQIICLFTTARCSLRGRICETFTKLQPSQLALQTLLILSLNIADEELQRKAANFLTSVMNFLSSASTFPSSSHSSRLQNLLKGCEFLVWSGAQEAGGSEFVKNCVGSIQGVVDTNEPARLYTTVLTEENFKKELEKKEKEGNFVVLGWLLCCMGENAKMISETFVTDIIYEILKRENGVMKAFALIVLFHLFTVSRYKTSTSLLREIFSDPNQEQTIVELANSLKSAQKRKK